MSLRRVEIAGDGRRLPITAVHAKIHQQISEQTTRLHGVDALKLGVVVQGYFSGEDGLFRGGGGFRHGSAQNVSEPSLFCFTCRGRNLPDSGTT